MSESKFLNLDADMRNALKDFQEASPDLRKQRFLEIWHLLIDWILHPEFCDWPGGLAEVLCDHSDLVGECGGNKQTYMELAAVVRKIKDNEPYENWANVQTLMVSVAKQFLGDKSDAAREDWSEGIARQKAMRNVVEALELMLESQKTLITSNQNRAQGVLDIFNFELAKIESKLTIARDMLKELDAKVLVLQTADLKAMSEYLEVCRKSKQ